MPVGFWDVALSGDLFGTTTPLKLKQKTRGFEEHADDLRWEPGSFVPHTPAWHRPSIRGPYKGRASWWTELDWEDPIVARGRNRYLYFAIKEEDELWWNPPVKKGTSKVGLAGYDTIYVPTHHSKNDRPIPLEEWRDQVTRGTVVGAKLYSTFPAISAQHPGLAVGNMGLVEPMMGKSPGEVGVATRDGLFDLPSLWRLYPRFWDAPIGEHTGEKTLFGAKAGFYAGFLYSAFNLVTKPEKFFPESPDFQAEMQYPRAWLRAMRLYVPYTTGMGAAYCGTLSMTAGLRGKDDAVNLVVPAALVGSIHGSLTGRFAAGLRLAAFVWLGSAVWHTGRHTQFGLWGDAPVTKSSWGALDSKWLHDQGAHVPKKRVWRDADTPNQSQKWWQDE